MTSPRRALRLLVATLAVCGGVLSACALPPPESKVVQERPALQGNTNVTRHHPGVSVKLKRVPRPLTFEDIAPGRQPAQRQFTPPTPQVASAGPALTVRVKDQPKKVRFEHANVGLSFEATDLADEQWDPEKSTLFKLVEALDNPSLRFGGNAVDRRMWWTSTNEPAPEWARATVTPADFERLGRFVHKAGATVTLVVDLGHDDPARAADFVYHARAGLGDRLVAVTVGNEPNGFNLESQPHLKIRDDSWGTGVYVSRVRAYVKAIHARVPDVNIIGPGAYDSTWWRAFADAKLPRTVALSQHWYPLWSCDGVLQPRAFPTVENLASPWLHQRAEIMFGRAAATASSYRLPLWIEEIGPTSCPGTNATSRTHAQALWTTDIVLNAASKGAQRLNLHSMLGRCRGGAPMSVVCQRLVAEETKPTLTGQANYLALLQLARLREGPLVPVTVSGDARVFAYGVSDADGLDLVIVNFNDPASVGASPLTLKLPEGYRVEQASSMYADALDVRNETKLIPWSPTKAVPKTINAGSTLTLRLAKATT